MKIVFCSNYMNHHQLYLSRALAALPDTDYTFIASEPMEGDRLQGGWQDMNTAAPWIVRAYESKVQFRKAMKLIGEADLVVAGSCPMKWLRRRVLRNKPVFLYSERWFKTGDGDIRPYRDLHHFLSNLLHRKYFNFFKVYMLCASAYTAYDCSIYHNFKGKCFKWGYFPETVKYDVDQLLAGKSQKGKVKILWAGRFLDWKHPEIAVKISERLKNDGFAFQLDMIGSGPMQDSVAEMAEKAGLNGYVFLQGAMHPEQVRQYMENADIFLFTSDFNEGWGAVLNEAMNSACAVVACHAIGSVPFLVDDGVNGFIYNYKDTDEMYGIVKRLVNDGALRKKIGQAAYDTIAEEWNADVAAKRLRMLYERLIEKKDIKIEHGICSEAKILQNFWRERPKDDGREPERPQ